APPKSTLGGAPAAPPSGDDLFSVDSGALAPSPSRAVLDVPGSKGHSLPSSSGMDQTGVLGGDSASASPDDATVALPGARRDTAPDLEATTASVSGEKDKAKPKSKPSLGDMPASLGGYQIVKLLGQGGMGAVYLARQVSLDRKVALKVMNPQWAS